jgi:DNA-binding XRE family transcriptional regulator
MRANKEYTRALKQARTNLSDARARGSDAIGGDALECMRGFLTPEEVSASDLRVAMMVALAHARKERGLSQKKLEELSGVRQPVIARMERGSTSPQLDTVLKVLAPLGKTLAIVPLESK